MFCLQTCLLCDQAATHENNKQQTESAAFIEMIKVIFFSARRKLKSFNSNS